MNKPKKKKSYNSATAFILPDDLRKELNQIAEREDRSLGYVIRELLWKAINQREKNYE